MACRCQLLRSKNQSRVKQRKRFTPDAEDREKENICIIAVQNRTECPEKAGTADAEEATLEAAIGNRRTSPGTVADVLVS